MNSAAGTDIAPLQPEPVISVYDLQQSPVNRFAQQAALGHCHADGIMIKDLGQNMHPAGELRSYEILQYEFIEDKRINFFIHDLLQTVLFLFEGPHGNPVPGEKIQAFRLAHRADTDPVQIMQATDLIAQLTNGKRRRDGGRKTGDQDDR